MKRIVSKVRRSLSPVGSVDAVTGTRVVGWAAGRGNVMVEAWVDGECVVRGRPDGKRDDVAAAFPERASALTSGYSLELPANAIPEDAISELRIVARPTSALLPSTTLGSFQLAGSALQQVLTDAGPLKTVGPFPKDVANLVAAQWPEDCVGLHEESGQRRFVKRLKQLLATPGVNSLPALAAYARYLAATLAHCRFVERHFPATNARAGAGASDFHCKPNSVRELLPIIHQLYVLRSFGVQGDFAEFGCFKGYSSAMLSFACEQLGITMHIFDSFEGLPPSEGAGYEAGQYAGSLDEVRANVTAFGSVRSVEFHKGFFADTLRDWLPPPLMCLWMDVDLEVSSRDLMVAAERLDARGTVFSHECPASIFRNGEVVSPPSPDNPIAPLLRRFEELGRPLTGHYVAGYTGAFWPRENGIPVLSTDVLFDLVSDYDR